MTTETIEIKEKERLNFIEEIIEQNIADGEDITDVHGLIVHIAAGNGPVQNILNMLPPFNFRNCICIFCRNVFLPVCDVFCTKSVTCNRYSVKKT